MVLTLPPGKYYIGDPCYVIDTDWDAVLDLHESPTKDAISTGLRPRDPEDKIFEFKGCKLWMHSTAYGDGSYMDQNGNEYGVDSGLLGAIPLELIDDADGEIEGRVVDAPNGLVVSYEDGTFYLGDTVIKTQDDPEYPDPYAGDDEDDDLPE